MSWRTLSINSPSTRTTWDKVTAMTRLASSVMVYWKLGEPVAMAAKLRYMQFLVAHLRVEADGTSRGLLRPVAELSDTAWRAPCVRERQSDCEQLT